MNDKLDQHHGLQLSALMDGELAPDQARFLLRRLQHDGELADRWERWQLAGDALRGRAGVPLPGGFAGRVAEALRAEAAPATPTRRPPGLLRWAGMAALAASVAVVALMVPRPAPDAQLVGGSRIAASQAGQARAVADKPEAGVAERAVAPVVAGRPAAEAPVAPDARVLASNDRPAPAVSRSRMSPPASGLAPSQAAPASERRVDTADASSSSQLAARESTPADPFSDVPLVSRPWPRAVLPQFGNGGALATGLPEEPGSAPPSFYPFEPRLPAPAAPRETEPRPGSTRPPAPR